MTPEMTPIILFSGMAADERLFAAQREEFSNVVTPAWIEPREREPLPVYAARLAALLDPGRECIVGGASFGGIIALEAAAHVGARACVLISSVRSPREMPWRYRLLRPLASMSPDRLGWAAGQLAALSSVPRDVGHKLRRLNRPDAAFLRWATWAVMRWRPSEATRQVRVFQIHGDTDRTFPIRCTRPDCVVPGGGHLLTVTHARAINQYLRRVVQLTA